MSRSQSARNTGVLRSIRKSDQQDLKQLTTSMREVENKFLLMSHYANPHYICQCLMCEKEFKALVTKQTSNSPFQQKQVANTIPNRKSNMKLLLGFLCPKKNYKGLKIQIPEICFYQDGQPQSIFMASKEEIRMFKPSRLTNKQVLHIFLEQKRLYKEAVREKYESNIMKHIDLDQIHEKYLQSILPLFKPGGTEKQKGFIYMKIHKDNRQMMDSLVQHQNRDTDEVCLIRRLGGSFQLMNELQFVTLMKSRAIGSQDIQFIQSYVRPKSPSNCLIHSEFDCSQKIADSLLYERAEHEIEIVLEIISQISPNYIQREAAEQFESVLRSNWTDYALYQTYKIIHYINKTSDIKTERIKLAWLINDIDLFYLYSVPEFVYEKIKFEKDEKLTKLQFERAKGQIKSMEGVQNWLLEKWQGIKKFKDIDNDHLIPKPPNRSKDVFELLHPGLNFERMINSSNFQKQVHRITENYRKQSMSVQLSRRTSRNEAFSPNVTGNTFLKSTYARTTQCPSHWAKIGGH